MLTFTLFTLGFVTSPFVTVATRSLPVFDDNRALIGHAILKPTKDGTSLCFIIACLSGFQLWMLSVFLKELDKKQAN
jgi:hypothetical protein